MRLLGRPGEIIAIRVADIHPAFRSRRDGLHIWSVTIADREVGRLSQAGTMDDTIAVDYPTGLGPLLAQTRSRDPPLFNLADAGCT